MLLWTHTHQTHTPSKAHMLPTPGDSPPKRVSIWSKHTASTVRGRCMGQSSCKRPVSPPTQPQRSKQQAWPLPLGLQEGKAQVGSDWGRSTAKLLAADSRPRAESLCIPDKEVTVMRRLAYTLDLRSVGKDPGKTQPSRGSRCSAGAAFHSSPSVRSTQPWEAGVRGKQSCWVQCLLRGRGQWLQRGCNMGCMGEAGGQSPNIVCIGCNCVLSTVWMFPCRTLQDTVVPSRDYCLRLTDEEAKPQGLT